MIPTLFADQVRRAVVDTFDEAEFFDGMSRQDVARYTELINALPDAVLVSLARNLRSLRRSVPA